MTRITSIACLLICLLLNTQSFAADAAWYKLGKVTFPERRTIKITNPTTAPVQGFPVRINLNDLPVSDEARGTAVIVDPEAKPSQEGETGGALVPHQVINSVLTFSASVPPNKDRTYYLYTTKDPIQGVHFVPQTSADIREAWRSFENNKMAFRIEVGPKAKTTGLTIDAFGKTKQGQAEGAILKKIYDTDYHEPQPWGIDILKVGTSPGLGGVYVVDGDKLARTNHETTEFKVLEGENGPVMTKVQAQGPVEINGKKLTVIRTMTLTADDRGIRDEVEIKGDPKALEGLKLGIGIRNLPQDKWTEDPKTGIAYVDGTGNQKGTDRMGLGFAFVPAKYVRTEQIRTPATAPTTSTTTAPAPTTAPTTAPTAAPTTATAPVTAPSTAPTTVASTAPTTAPLIIDTINGGHIVILTPDPHDGGLISRHHLGAYWNGDGDVSTADAFAKVLADWSLLLQSPAKVDIGNPEKAPAAAAK